MAKTFDGERRAADVVIVPNVTGLSFLAARDVASSAGLSLANPDPDGPPIGALVWPNNPMILRQDPAPGTVARRWDSLRVWLRSDLEPDMARPLDDSPPSADSAHAIPEEPY
ncbi:PASTA domain-containing protein [Arthrobacter sp. 35W]|uniref:PASTA domain-containing protein n=1 Tax=Arthrobacter sp. 35W TaxID=1132441 RepID=UPI000687FF8D